uniref:Uncharacterized protein n=1 Tax=Sipha flava TaxID=143950 RepID=A0A2S2Q696_9HEMI
MITAGPLFPTSKSINVCEILITLQADIASSIQFSERGRKMCSEACEQYQKKVITNGSVDVSLLQGYCDYSNDGDKIEQTDLKTTCICAYRVGCNNKSSMLLYTFQANDKGHLKVSMSEPNKLKPII